MGGVSTMVWKETREQYLRSGRPAFSFWFGVLLDLGLGVGIPLFLASLTPSTKVEEFFLPAAIGAGIAAIAFQATISPLAVVVDSIAGERERHTLETLLASPLSDSAILWGKVVSMYLVAIAHGLLFGLVFGITVTVLAGPAGLAAAVIVPVVGTVFGLVLATFFIMMGVLLSLRAANVKQGQQWFSFILMPIFLAVPLSSSLGVTRWLAEASNDARVLFVVLLAASALVVDVGLTLWVRWAFRRERLILH